MAPLLIRKVAFIYTLLTALQITAVSAVRDLGETKLEMMRKLRDNSADGIIEFTAEEYQ